MSENGLADVLGGRFAQPVGFDELGRPLFRLPTGQTVGQPMPQQQNALATALRTEVDPMTGRAVHYQDEIQPTRTGNALSALAEGFLQGITAPGRAARGEALTMGDVWATAIDNGLLAAPMPAPRGAIRAGAMRSIDEILTGPDDELVTLYHGTTRGAADEILRSQRLRSAGEPSVYLTNDPTGAGYGDGTVVQVQVPRRMLQIDDEFPSGRADFSIGLSRPGGAIPVRASLPPQSPADEIARMLREGRASEITDDMMARLSPEDNVRLFRLYEEGATGQPMPMDEASRMARAREMGLIDNQYHATAADFYAFRPSDAGLAGRGVYTGDFPEDVSVYATARMDGNDRTGLNIIPVRAPADATYASNVAYHRAADADTQWPYNATMEENIAGMRRVADRLSADGYSGVRSQPGERVTFDPRNIRSRFARFDPRLSHLAHLSAGGAGAAVLAGSGDREQQITDYLRQIDELSR